MSEWQPIETAPKDKGKFILVCTLLGDNFDDYDASVATVIWTDRFAGLRPENEKNYIWANWNEGLDDNDVWADYGQPTHWMPLPAPPNKA